ncbi:cytochrome b/b6 domain-containing protein [Hoeflea sp. EC-HK425]|uniref:cytochrome b/b6 domain-containing protein n=1 Tax=Hoeflea sp. EC-HK425 TaxID=2038388 RepID=UPI00125B46C4|nr:cytochrome b/b6 domain-containing protein [Hoeflea sp. EC-HK425]VVT09496.1 Cytochrome b [Hoeflea sp. EC-HK425]|tara:strand:+ start:327 stop:908 length:582 start_codon:yes stop_codon:yes gene_type:complete
MTPLKATMEAGDIQSPATVRVWDPLVRIFHWSLVGLFTFAFLTGDEWQKPHEVAGYIIAGLIAFRVIWGFAGTRHARFSSFIYRPSTVAGFLADTMRMKARRYLGHNPAGGLMVLGLLLAIAVISLSGWMMTTDAYWGVGWVQELHEAAAFSAVGLVALHVGGVLVASFEHGENLVRAMVTGRKRAPGPNDIA